VAGVNYQLMPTMQPGALFMGSNQDLRNKDKEIFSARNWNATANAGTLTFRYGNATATVNVPRLVLQSATLYWTMLAVPQLMQPQPNIDPGTPAAAGWLYSRTNVMPSVDLSGQRWFPMVAAANIPIMAQWFAKRLHIPAQTILVNFETVNPPIPFEYGNGVTDFKVKSSSSSVQGDVAVEDKNTSLMAAIKAVESV